MDNINSSTKVFVWFLHPSDGRRVWVTAVQNQFDKQKNRLVLQPNLTDAPGKAQPFRYEFAVRMRERFLEDLGPLCAANFSHDPNGSEVGVSARSSGGDDNRTRMAFRGLIATPGFDVKLGRVWYCRFPNTAIESCRGESPEDVINKVYERGPEAVKLAEQAPPIPEPQAEAPKVNSPRMRPGDRY
jgi:hypothetical protein